MNSSNEISNDGVVPETPQKETSSKQRRKILQDLSVPETEQSGI